MCGIAGAHGLEAFEGLDDATGRVRDMVRTLAHRGPDAEGVWTDEENVVLGHRRLSILDTGEGANQPFSVGDDTLVFNGEVYNYLELRRELEAEGAHRFATSGDTEVVLVALRHWGLEDAIRRFNGMFAFAWWSSATRRACPTGVRAAESSSSSRTRANAGTTRAKASSCSKGWWRSWPVTRSKTWLRRSCSIRWA